MIFKLLVFGMLLVAFLPGAVFSQDISLELVMPGTLFSPGSPFYLDLSVVNIEIAALSGSQLFVALSIGSDFWFYPQWVKYPPDLDWMDLDIAGQSNDTMTLIPEFPWPDGAGAFSGAMFLSVVVYNGALVSNLAEITFGWTETSQPTPTPTPAPHSVSVGNMISISSGSFVQGSPPTEPCRGSDETQFTHNLTRNLSVMETEVTRQMWVDLKTVQPSLPDDPSFTTCSPTMAHPVQQNTWRQAVLFANLLSLQNGYTRCYYTDAGYTTPITASNYTDETFHCDFDADGYRLPTEGEWEYFTRAGTTGPFSCTESLYTSSSCGSCRTGAHPTLELYCVYCAIDPGGCEVAGSKLANPWGLKDVHGSVWEYCWDWYGAYPTGAVSDYTGAGSGPYRSLRGGSWRSSIERCRSAGDREWDAPDGENQRQGFRLARTSGQ